MKDCKIIYKGDEDQNLKAGLLEELGFKNIGVHDNMSKCWLMTYDTVGFKHVCTDKGFAELKELTLPQLRDLVAQKKNEQGLISGADALRALADGYELQYSTQDGYWNNCSFLGFTVDDLLNDKQYKFRLKPRTITLSLEIPAPKINPECADKDSCIHLNGNTYAWGVEEFKVVKELLSKAFEGDKQ